MFIRLRHPARHVYINGTMSKSTLCLACLEIAKVEALSQRKRMLDT